MKNLILFTFICINYSWAQQKDSSASKKTDNKKEFKGIVTYATIVNGDTLPMVYLKPVWCVEKRVFKNQFQAWKYQRLIKNIKAAYPFAKIAGRKMKEYNKLLINVKSEEEKHRMMKKIEKELKSEFEDDLKDLTITQGRILLKLIDRETGNTSYAIVKELRGTFSATFWQTLAVLFGNDLKSEYNSAGDDKQIEEIIQLIEKGEI